MDLFTKRGEFCTANNFQNRLKIAHFLVSGVASQTVWLCDANLNSSLFISLEIDCFYSL